MASAGVTNANFFAPEVVADPYPMLEDIRALGPVVHHEAMDLWMVIGFDDIRYCAARPEVFRFPAEWLELSYTVVTMEGLVGADHLAVRDVWADDFHRKHVQGYRGFVDPLVTEVVDAFTDRVNAGQTVEFMQECAYLIPTYVVTKLMGIDMARRPEYARWSEDMGKLPLAMIDTDPERAAATMALVDAGRDNMIAALHEEIEQRAGEETDDLIGRAFNSSPLSVQERVGNIAAIVFAGYGTTAKLLGHAMVQLARHPEQRALLLEDRSLIPQAIEEVLRYCGIIMMTPRVVTEDGVEVGGVPVPKGANVGLMFSTANWDPTRWEEPSRFDITRPAQQHYAFGFGPHHCLGQALARLEAEIFLNALLDRLPAWEVDGDVEYGVNFDIRGPETLRIAAPR